MCRHGSENVGARKQGKRGKVSECQIHGEGFEGGAWPPHGDAVSIDLGAGASILKASLIQQ